MALKDNLSSYWKLDEASGTRVDSHSSQDLTDNNTVGSEPAVINNGAVFVTANSESLISASNFTAYGTSAVSVQAWLKTSTDNATSFVVAINDGGAETFQIFKDGAANTYAFRIRAGGSPADSPTIADTTLENGAFHHIVATYDGSTIRIYRNASQVGTGTAKTGNIETGFPDKLGIGARNGSGTPGGFWTGTVDEVAVWSRALTSSEVTELYNSGAGLSYDEINTADTANALFFGHAF